jgi:hypothetical protein
MILIKRAVSNLIKTSLKKQIVKFVIVISVILVLTG